MLAIVRKVLDQWRFSMIRMRIVFTLLQPSNEFDKSLLCFLTIFRTQTGRLLPPVSSVLRARHVFERTRFASGVLFATVSSASREAVVNGR